MTLSLGHFVTLSLTCKLTLSQANYLPLILTEALMLPLT
ncbi:hypothetical protein DBR06_SOUSAS17010051, partial [Sousa chinensis]